MQPNTDLLTLVFASLIVVLPPLLHHLFGGSRIPEDLREGDQ